jgi:uncharacterized protein (DUF2236 family)
VAGSDGLFGPGSVTWRVHCDPVYPVAMLRALVMQALNLGGLAVVLATGRRSDDPWERLHHALQISGTLSFGDVAQAAIAGARERAVRTQVRGRLDDGRPFRGDDPDVLLWMHTCHVSSALEVTRRAGLELSDAACDEYLREQVRAAAVLGLEPDRVPASRGALARTLRAARPRLRVSYGARTFLNSVIAPDLPAPMLTTQRYRPTWAAVAGLVFPTLPGWARTIYGNPTRNSAAALSQPATTVALHALRDSMLAVT